MIIDDKGRLFGKVSIIDIIAVLVLVVVGILAYKFILPSSSGYLAPKNDTLHIVFYEEEVNSFTANRVKIGDVASERLQNADFGKVIDVKVDKSVSWGESSEGEFIISNKEGFSSIYITMEAKGILDRNGIIIDKAQYYIGQYITLYVGDCALYGIIYSAEKK
ncbi:MAG TPA: DUF4330 domain-containing protein [Clostridiaceae bacterium]|nr:DUF4330 domain-containing protein [Clostridiaceae bacterium]